MNLSPFLHHFNSATLNLSSSSMRLGVISRSVAAAAQLHISYSFFIMPPPFKASSTSWFYHKRISFNAKSSITVEMIIAMLFFETWTITTNIAINYKMSLKTLWFMLRNNSRRHVECFVGRKSRSSIKFAKNTWSWHTFERVQKRFKQQPISAAAAVLSVQKKSVSNFISIIDLPSFAHTHWDTYNRVVDRPLTSDLIWARDMQ